MRLLNSIKQGGGVLHKSINQSINRFILRHHWPSRRGRAAVRGGQVAGDAYQRSRSLARLRRSSKSMWSGVVLTSGTNSNNTRLSTVPSNTCMYYLVFWSNSTGSCVVLTLYRRYIERLLQAAGQRGARLLPGCHCMVMQRAGVSSSSALRDSRGQT